MSEDNTFKSLFDSPEWKELQKDQSTWEDEFEKESEDTWNALDKEDQLKVFCAISRRIFQAELRDKGTYRHALYNVFGFGTDAYAPAQISGYLSIHNAIYDGDRLSEIAEQIKKFAEDNNVDPEKTQALIDDILMF